MKHSLLIMIFCKTDIIQFSTIVFAVDIYARTLTENHVMKRLVSKGQNNFLFQFYQCTLIILQEE